MYISTICLRMRSRLCDVLKSNTHSHMHMKHTRAYQYTYSTSHKEVNVRQAYNGYGYGQSMDTRTGVVDFTYAYNTGKATDMLRTTYG